MHKIINHHWFKDGELIAETDREFYTYHFGKAVTEYNNRELEALGLQQEVSAVFGIYYYYNKGVEKNTSNSRNNSPLLNSNYINSVVTYLFKLSSS